MLFFDQISPVFESVCHFWGQKGTHWSFFHGWRALASTRGDVLVAVLGRTARRWKPVPRRPLTQATSVWALDRHIDFSTSTLPSHQKSKGWSRLLVSMEFQGNYLPSQHVIALCGAPCSSLRRCKNFSSGPLLKHSFRQRQLEFMKLDSWKDTPQSLMGISVLIRASEHWEAKICVEKIIGIGPIRVDAWKIKLLRVFSRQLLASISRFIFFLSFERVPPYKYGVLHGTWSPALDDRGLALCIYPWHPRPGRYFLHTVRCALQPAFWHSGEQYKTVTPAQWQGWQRSRFTCNPPNFLQYLAHCAQRSISISSGTFVS